MKRPEIDLRKEHQATLARPRYRYSAAARFFFRTMDFLAGEETTLTKAKLVETLASIPYRAWENRQYGRLTQHYGDQRLVQHAESIMLWGRKAQDNEYRHLLVLNEKLREDGAEDPRFLTPPLPLLAVTAYSLLSWTLARLDIRRAFLFNAEFEDHAEHYWAQLVHEHPEWEEQPITSELVTTYGAFHSWADVFRRISLDERDHMNASFVFAGKPHYAVAYTGMPEMPAA